MTSSMPKFAAMRLILSMSFLRASSSYFSLALGDRLITVEPIEHLQIGRDGADVAGCDGFGRELHHGREAIQLQLRMIGAAVDRPFLQDLGDDLPDALAVTPSSAAISS